jgi:hypothetical protein
VDPDRLKLYRYVTAPEAGDYLAIMDRFTDALFAEWSAQDVIAQGVDLSMDTVVARCRYLADNGNLLLSPREVRVTTIAEYQSQPARYTVSALGARLRREVTAFLAVTGGAREVPRELLALVAEGLARLDPGGEPESLAGAVSTIFGQFHEFAASVTDFYTYIGSVLTRSDLDGDEWAGFKGLLLDYLESIVESVRRHSHAISDSLARLRPELPRLLDRISESDGAFASLQAASPGGEDVERARGRTRGDWDQLEAWFIGPGARQLRDAAHRAVGAMLTSLKRPGQRGQGGIPQKIRLFDVSLRVFIERVWSPGTDEIGMGRGRARDYPAVRGVSIDATFVGSKSSFFGSFMTTRGRGRPWSGDVGWSACGHRRR